ncbi:unnamed protein product [Ophioblennius macclurei]
MTAEEFARFPRTTWLQVLQKVKHALVLVDDRCAEALHWSGGAPLLLEAGARNVRRFCVDAWDEHGHEPRVVFVLSTRLDGRVLDAVREVVRASRARHCSVFTCVPHALHLPHAHAEPDDSGQPAFTRLEEKLRAWMGGAECTAEVAHAPVVFAPVSPPRLVLAPAFAHLFPLLAPDLERVNAARPERKRFADVADLDVHALPHALQVEVRSLAAALDALFDATCTREESFAVGPLSRVLAGELAALPRARSRRKSAANRASVVFVDRTLDLTGAVGHHGDNLVEKILSTLSPLPGHVTDVQVDMMELAAGGRSKLCGETLAPGCLSQNQSPAAMTLWDAMLTSKQKEGVMEVRRHLVEAASKEKLPIKMSMGRVTPEQLCSYVQPFRSSWGALESHSGVLQLGLATAQTLRHPHLPRWDACLAFERLLLQALGDSAFPAVLRQLLPLMKPRPGDGGDDPAVGSRVGEDECGPDELILLLIYLYSLADEAQPSDEEEEELEKLERELIGALTLVIIREAELSPLLQKLTGCEDVAALTTERAHSAVEKMFDTLRGLSRTRDHLKQLRSVYAAGDGVHQATYRPLLKQILDEIFHPDRRECPDMEHMSGGLTDLLKTGFSMFMKVNRPHPADNPLLILFVVGGVTPSELRLIKETVAAHKQGPQVLVFSTRLLRPTDVAELLFDARRLAPDVGV